MNYFHLEAKVISRGAGRSVVAAAAYASCSKLYNDYDGLTHDYIKKRGCLYSEIFLPEYAPLEWQDRQKLWEAVETVEKTKDSRLARELIVALPMELSLEDWKDMLSKFVWEQATELGMCADVSIHDTDGHNPHAHILLTVRPLNEQGKWQAKTQKEYLCYRNGEEQGFTAEEFKIAKADGWEKLYQYRVGKKKVYLSPSEAEKNKDCVRLSKTPKSTRYGRQNPISAQWNSEEQLFAWRISWEEIVNEEQKRHNLMERVDCRSHVARGLKEQPTIHEGYYAKNLEILGIVSERCKWNRLIREDNKNLQEQRKQVQKLIKAIKENVHSVAFTLEALREHMVFLQYRMSFNILQQEELLSQKNILSDVLNEYNKVQVSIKEKTKERKKLLSEQKTCGIHFIRANKLREQAAMLMEEIEELKSNKIQLLYRLDCQENEVKIQNQKLKEIEMILGKLKQQYLVLFGQKKDSKIQFMEIKNNIILERMEEVWNERVAMRLDNWDSLIKQLIETYQKRYSNSIFTEANKLIDKELQEPVIQREKRTVKEYLKASGKDGVQREKQKKKEYQR